MSSALEAARAFFDAHRNKYPNTPKRRPNKTPLVYSPDLRLVTVTSVCAAYALTRAQFDELFAGVTLWRGKRITAIPTAELHRLNQLKRPTLPK